MQEDDYKIDSQIINKSKKFKNIKLKHKMSKKSSLYEMDDSQRSIKCVAKVIKFKEDEFAQVSNEPAIQSNLKHENVVQIISVETDTVNKRVAILMPKYEQDL